MSNMGVVPYTSCWIPGGPIFSELITVPYDEKKKPAITLFSDPDCSGISAAYYAGSKGENVEYNTSLMQQGNMSDNTISSVKVPFGAYLTLYTEDGFVGNPFVVDGSANNLLGKEPACVNLQNDVFSSFKI